MIKIKTLDELANFYKTDKGTMFETPCKHGYAPIYDELLTPLRDKDISLLEVGVWLETSSIGGESLNMWKEYFKNANIYAFDIRDMKNHPFFVNNTNVYFYNGDQGNRDDFVSMHNAFNNVFFDFILEDGSHNANHQMISFASLFKYVKPGGIYILEDITLPGVANCNGMNNNPTWYTLNGFIENKQIISNYLTDEETSYLTDNIDKIIIHNDIKNQWATAIIYKK
jgi:hypothetical protein